MDIKEIENEIDIAFEDNNIKSLSYSQAIWEILSCLEEKHYQLLTSDISSYEQSAAVDNMINLITHPLRVCFKNCTRRNFALNSNYSKQNSNDACDWYSKAYDYNHFCSIFPLVHRKKLSLFIKEHEINTDKDLSNGVPYEAYNRFLYKTGESIDRQVHVDVEQIINASQNYVFQLNGKIAIAWNAKLSKKIIHIFNKSQSHRYHLPDTWKFTHFSLGEFKKVAVAITALSYTRSVFTTIKANTLPNYGYQSRVWVISKEELTKILVDALDFNEIKIKNILEYLTFGAKGIQYPDAATQPLFDLEDNNYAISPFLFINSDIERNICALLNQIVDDKQIYSRLVDEKQHVLYAEIKNELSSFGFRCESGKVENTDLDLAIIDDENKFVLTVELKWFIEPAEIREVIERAKEIEKGIKQAEKIKSLLTSNDFHIQKELLKIDDTYKHYSIVGSFNWAGPDWIQSKKIPVIKIGHLMELIRKNKNLHDISTDLNNRKYLPVLGDDYEVVHFKINSGNWYCDWYGLKSLK
ncbi:hypothetical protein ACE1V3_09970 [Aeromonas veronii bv. sobria]|uniref:hypothetical protein n=1 Tax=Aeromonas veronii TaxID=654 RepID=UPI002B480089|nr:hypothetical protein [Aeromonas veronii]